MKQLPQPPEAMNTKTHSQLPFTVNQSRHADAQNSLRAANGHIICWIEDNDTGPEQAAKNLEFLARAANFHYFLVDQLERAAIALTEAGRESANKHSQQPRLYEEHAQAAIDLVKQAKA